MSNSSADWHFDTALGEIKPRAGGAAELDTEYIEAVTPDVTLAVDYSDEHSLLECMSPIPAWP